LEGAAGIRDESTGGASSEAVDSAPSGDSAQVTFRRRGGAAEVRLGVANSTTPLVGSGECPRRQIEAAAGSVLSGGGGTQGGGRGAAR
jgi:hypothetical protein